MTTKFSLVYPTRHRPQFIEMALKFLEKQEYENLEIIVSDNYTDDNLSCREICSNSPLAEKICYVKPPNPLGMVENWNFALQFATGDYVCYFTDKNFLLPGTLRVLNQVLFEKKIDIVSWKGHFFTPADEKKNFAEGSFQQVAESICNLSDFDFYEPYSALEKKSLGITRREEQDYADYVRGKICFGCYSSHLIEKVENFAGKLFHNIAPDYTSMILGLFCAENAIEFKGSGIVQLNAEISNGAICRVDDSGALSFVKSLNVDLNSADFLVPGLYSSQHNLVSYDYLSLQRKFQMTFEFDREKWLYHVWGDLVLPERVWSSVRAKAEQEGIFRSFLCNEGLRSLSLRSFSERKSIKLNPPLIKKIIPVPIKKMMKALIRRKKGAVAKKCRLTDLIGL